MKFEFQALVIKIKYYIDRNLIKNSIDMEKYNISLEFKFKALIKVHIHKTIVSYFF